MTNRIAALTAIFMIACTDSGPGMEPPSGGAFGNPQAGEGGVGGGGVGGSSGGAGTSMSSGGEDGSGEGGSAGIVGGAGGMSAGGQGGEQTPPGDAGAQDASVEDGGSRDLDTGWSDACGSVTHNGHCEGDVYEWCDYYTRGLKQLDCGALGMTCRDGLQPNEDATNGCVGDPCAQADEHCEGSLRYDCRQGEILVTDCQKKFGPASSCEVVEGELYIGCTRAEPCDTPNLLWCDAELEVICDEEGKQYIIDCQAHDLGGRCVVESIGDPQCDPLLGL